MKGYKVRFKASSPKKGYKYKTVAGYANAMYKKYKDKIDAGTKLDSEEKSKKLFKALLKDEMINNPTMTMKQAASKILSTETFTSAEERTEMRFKKDFSEFRKQLGYEKGHRFRNKQGKYISLKEAMGKYVTEKYREGEKMGNTNVEKSGYHFTDYRPDENGKLHAYEYIVKYNYSPKAGQSRWQITLVSIKSI